jgi:hypothetical protein
MNGQPISGLNGPTTNDQAANMGFVNQQVKKAAPRNLLDNSDFQNPVNQRGQTSYSGTPNAYSIDRWYLSTSLIAIEIATNGIDIDNRNNTSGTGHIRQKLVGLKNGRYTLMSNTNEGMLCRWFTLTDGVITDNTYENTNSAFTAVSYGNNVLDVGIGAFAASVITVYNAALYEGEYTAETLPKYQPKGYGAELVECQRYYLPIFKNSTQTNGFPMMAINSTLAHGLVNLPTTMRTNPTATFSNLVLRKGTTDAAITAVTANGVHPSGVALSITAEGLTAGTIYLVRPDWGYLILSADL